MAVGQVRPIGRGSLGPVLLLGDVAFPAVALAMEAVLGEKGGDDIDITVQAC